MQNRLRLIVGCVSHGDMRATQALRLVGEKLVPDKPGRLFNTLLTPFGNVGDMLAAYGQRNLQPSAQLRQPVCVGRRRRAAQIMVQVSCIKVQCQFIT